MKHPVRPFYRSALGLCATLLVTTAISMPAQAEFNPSEGMEPIRLQQPAARTLPSITPLLESSRYRSRSSGTFPSIAPAAAASAAPVQAPIPFAPVTTAGFPRVDAQTLQGGGFVAPAPLIAQPAPMPEPLVAPVVAAPVVVMPVPQDSVVPAVAAPATVAYVPAEPLSRDTKAILSRIPSKLDTAKPAKGSKVSVARVSPEMHDLQVRGKIDEYEASGIKISVRRPGLDTNHELNRAYTALSGGDSQQAIEIYRNILSTEPANADALFGLASIYHRQGQLDKARAYYGNLLKSYPSHREGLNNFLVLVSDESPQEALAELERLEQRNPDFSPIPAQQAMLLYKLGYVLEARNKMLRAIDLAPNNLTYKYNLAIMLDGQGDYANAADLYRLLLAASTRGEAIPTTAETIQKRLNFIATAMASHAHPVGG